MKIRSEMLFPAVKGKGVISLSRKYLDEEGLRIMEHRHACRQSDFYEDELIRFSDDNGESFSEWIPYVAENGSSGITSIGEDEVEIYDVGNAFDRENEMYLSTRLHRYFIGGHEASYRDLREGKLTHFDHQYILARRSGEDLPFLVQMIKYEDGCDFDESNPRNPDFLHNNIGYLNAPIVLKSGKIAVPVGVTVRNACKRAGLDVNEVFPSAPDIHRAVVVAIGAFDSKEEKFTFEFSSPVIIDDLRSSRGIDEPIIAELSSGRLLLVMRGSNARADYTRIAEGAPSYKWFSYSDDGGKTFSPAEPWRFDNGGYVYSSATISEFFRSSKNGKLYWIGNITSDKAYGNDPRYPLHIAEVDENSGLLKWDTVTVIDDRRDGECEMMQLSNFSLLEDRVTKNLHLFLGKIWQYDLSDPFYGETWKYEIEL